MKKKSDKKSREFWERAEKAAAEVDDWPDWKKATFLKSSGDRPPITKTTASETETMDDLIEIAPHLFRDNFYFECGEGWRPILSALIKYCNGQYKIWVHKKEMADKRDGDWLAEYFEANPENPMRNFKFVQIKEKFGDLRVYVEGNPHAEIDGAIRMAELLSASTCEVCGKPGTKGGTGWIVTRCEEHQS